MAAGLPLETLRRVWMVLQAPPQHLMVSMDGKLEEREPVIDMLKAPFDAYKGDRAFSNQVSRSLWMQPLVAGKTSRSWAGKNACVRYRQRLKVMPKHGGRPI